MKKVTLLLTLVFCFCFTSAYASADSATTSFDLQAKLESLEDAGGGTLVITDRSELEQIARDQGLDEVPTRVEYKYTPAVPGPDSQLNAVSTPDLSINATSSDVYWAKTADRGINYTPGDLYKSFTIDGPSSPGFKISETQKTYSSFTNTAGADLKVIEAAVGFTSGREFQSSWEDTTPIAKTERVTFNLYTKYHEVFYSVYHGPYGDANHSVCTGTGLARNPVGSYLQKIITNK